MIRRTFALSILVACFSLLFMSTPLSAQTINFAGGGTLSGDFTYDATTNTFLTWDITTSAAGSFSGATYTNTVAGSVGAPGGFNGANFYDFSIYTPTGGGSTLFFTVPGVADSSIAGLPTTGMTQLTLVTNDSLLAGAADCLGLQSPGAAPCGAEGAAVGYRYLEQPAYLNVTDPNSIYTFTFTDVPLTPLSATPEPGTGVLWLTGIVLMIVMRKRIAQTLRLETGTYRSLSTH
jgi:hypothetical protein